MNLPPSGKSGKKGQHGGGSSSSRARNVSHVTNKDSDKDVSANAKKFKKVSGEPSKKPAEKKKPVIIKSETTSSMNIQDGPRSRVVISSQDQARRGTAGNNPNEPPTSELHVSGSEADNPRVSIQVGSRDLRHSSNEISHYTNTQLDEYPDEMVLL